MKHPEPYPTDAISTRPVRFLTTQHREQIYPKDLANELVFHYSIPTVQALGTGAQELGTTIASNKWLIRDKCVLISRLNPRKATICRASPKEITTVASTEFVALSTGNCTDDRFLELVLSTPEVTEYLSAAATSATRSHQRVSPNDITNLKVPWPTTKTRNTIVRFLDDETAAIDAFIADQKRLIELLEERRAATIAHAVTKGLDTTAPMKDSGIDWLGYVPRHWQIARLKNSIQDAKNGVWGLEPDGSELDLRCVRVADFDRPRLSIHDRNATLRKIPLNEQKGRILNKGDLLLEKSGGGEKSPVGFVVRYDRDEPAVCSNFVARLALRPGMDSQFWTYLHSMLYSRRLTQRSIKQTTGIQNLDQASYFDELVAFPTHKEQCAIAEFLDREMAELDAAVSDAREAIALSRERRAALISAAVTGQMDVTQAQPRGSAGEMLGQRVRV